LLLVVAVAVMTSTEVLVSFVDELSDDTV